MDKVICWFSCGVTSAVATRLALSEFQNSEILIYFIKTGQEHPDSMRFLKDCERWFNHEIKVVSNGKYSSAWDVWERTKFLNGPTGARCTLELKKRVRWSLEDKLGTWSAQIFGFDASERKRAERFSEQYPTAKAVFPLITHNLSKSECMAILQHAEIDIPAMYKLGFPNNNCIGCVKGGMGYWNLIRTEFPDTFSRMSKLERCIGHSCINGTYLDELPDNLGKLPVIVPSCSLFCDPDFMNL